MNVAQESFIAIEFGWALLAWMTPSFAYGGTAELFRTDHPLQLTLAHVVADAREARTRPVICAVECECESINKHEQKRATNQSNNCRTVNSCSTVINQTLKLQRPPE